MQCCVKICVFLLFFTQSLGILNQDLMSINVNDILSEKLMPLSFLYVRESNNRNTISENQTNGKPLHEFNSRADFGSALNLMQFHRKMIQNYKCNNYIAKQILTDIAPISINNRLGVASDNLTGKATKLIKIKYWVLNNVFFSF